ncbi:MAG: lysophospholipid acyltransferase family protein [Candidatus Muirbacterium halophilum]|nr:lysophospholipid acyltransferase family protein [Candidatus Muirbacterium halophilum]MCK9474699.1 lysophospholipid acyltransferase family protein [Candidatus Muirbacterium halophilum]
MDKILTIIAILIYRFNENLRKVIFKNLNIILGNNIDFKVKKKIALKFLIFQLYNIIEFFLMSLGLFKLFNITVEGFENYKKEKDKGNNISFISGHFGNWELFGAWLSVKKFPLYSIILPPRNGILDKMLQYVRGKYNIGTIIRTNSREIFRKVNDKEFVVAFLIDQDGESSGIWTNFFGKKVSFPSGAASFAARKNNVFVPTIMERIGFLKHKVIFYPQIQIESENSIDRKKEFVQKTIEFYEKVIQEKPENWLLFYNRWLYRRHYPICRKNAL